MSRKYSIMEFRSTDTEYARYHARAPLESLHISTGERLFSRTYTAIENRAESIRSAWLSSQTSFRVEIPAQRAVLSSAWGDGRPTSAPQEDAWISWFSDP